MFTSPPKPGPCPPNCFIRYRIKLEVVVIIFAKLRRCIGPCVATHCRRGCFHHRPNQDLDRQLLIHYRIKLQVLVNMFAKFRRCCSATILMTFPEGRIRPPLTGIRCGFHAPIAMRSNTVPFATAIVVIELIDRIQRKLFLNHPHLPIQGWLACDCLTTSQAQSTLLGEHSHRDA